MDNRVIVTHGPIALVGSGEYLPVMQELEASLLAGRNPKFIQIPTAAAPEGQKSLDYWIDLGKKQAERIGVEAVPVVIRDRDEANSEAIASLIDGAGLIYFSGGNPNFLANTIRGTRTWEVIAEHWKNGTALAGCSAGAMALADHIPSLRAPWGEQTSGLGVLPHIRVLPHFDRMFARIPDFFQKFMHVPDGVTIVGIDEDTALVGGPHDWQVQGQQSAWVLQDGKRIEYPSGSSLITQPLVTN